MLRTFFFPAAYMDKLMLKTVVTRFCSDDRDRVLSQPSGSLLIGKSHWRIAQLPKQLHQRDPLPFFLSFFFFPVCKTIVPLISLAYITSVLSTHKKSTVL